MNVAWLMVDDYTDRHCVDITCCKSYTRMNNEIFEGVNFYGFNIPYVFIANALLLLLFSKTTKVFPTLPLTI